MNKDIEKAEKRLTKATTELLAAKFAYNNLIYSRHREGANITFNCKRIPSASKKPRRANRGKAR